MYRWSEEQQAFRLAVRDFVDRSIAPRRDELEYGDLPPYELLREMYRAFGLADLAREQFESHRSLADRGPEAAQEFRSTRLTASMIPIIEVCRYSPGMMTALGTSIGLTAGTILSRGTPEQREKWALPLLTLEKIGAWALTEPDAGSDAFGSMRSSAEPDGDGFVLRGSKTFISNAPYADLIVFMCKLKTDGDERPPVLSFVLEPDMPGVAVSRPLRKMGLHSSPTGDVFVDEVRVGRDRLVGEGRAATNPARPRSTGETKDRFATERAVVAAMALGIIEQCLLRSTQYACDRHQFGRPIGEFQLIQAKLAQMEVARLNVENLIFRYFEMAVAGDRLTLAEASAMKLYSARAAVEVALEAVQVMGGNGYMAENHVEQLARDAKVLQIYAGTDEQQIVAVARDLMRSRIPA